MQAEKQRRLERGVDDLIILQNPVGSNLRSPIFIFCTFIWGLYLFSTGCKTLVDFGRYGVMNYPRYQFVVNSMNLSFRGTESEKSISFEILDESCNSQPNQIILNLSAAVQNISLSRPVPAHGFRLIPLSWNTSVSLEFFLYGYDIAHDDWILVGASRYQKLIDGIQILAGGDTQVAHSGADFSYLPDWPLRFMTGWTRIWMGGLLVLTCVAALRGPEALARRVAGAGLILCGGLHAASFLGFAVLRMWSEAAAPALYFAILAAAGTLLLAAPGFEARGILGLAVALWLLAWALECHVLDDCRGGSGPVGQDLAVVVACGMLITPFTWRLPLAAVAAVQQDAERLMRAWEEQVRLPKRDALDNLQRASARVSEAYLRRAVRQMFVPEGGRGATGSQVFADGSQVFADGSDVSRKPRGGHGDLERGDSSRSQAKQPAPLPAQHKEPSELGRGADAGPADDRGRAGSVGSVAPFEAQETGRTASAVDAVAAAPTRGHAPPRLAAAALAGSSGHSSSLRFRAFLATAGGEPAPRARPPLPPGLSGINLPRRQPVQSLGYLFAQGAAAAGPLRALGEEWCASAGGELSVASVMPRATDFASVRRASQEPDNSQAGTGLEPWPGLAPTDSMNTHVHTGGLAPTDSMNTHVHTGALKPPRRAALKALTCYGGDVSRLLDVCRVRIWFDDVEGVTRGLEAVAGDARVRVVRVKNTMVDGADVWRSAGFRSVILNVCLRGEHAAAMMLEHHICEVQLVLKAFQCIQDPTVHMRYLRFRDARSSSVASLLLRAALFLRDAAGIRSATVSPAPPPDQSPAKLSSSSPLATDGRARSEATLSCNKPGSYNASAAAASAATTNSSSPAIAASAAVSDGLEGSPALDVYRWAVSNPGTSIDHLYRRDTVIHASSVLFTSKPIGASASRWNLQLVGLAVAAFYLYRSTEYLLALTTQGLFDPAPTDFRLTPVGLRQSSMPLTAANAFEFGLARGGCILPQAGGVALRASGNGTSPAVLSLPFAVLADGYYLSTADGEPERDVVRWVLEICTRDAGGECKWKLAGASARRGVGDMAMYSSAMPFPVPLERGGVALVDQRPTWPDGALDLGSGLVVSLGWFLFVGCGRRLWLRLAKASVVWAFALAGVLCGIAAVGYAADGRWFEFAIGVLWLLANLSLSAVGQWWERFSFYALAWFGALLLLIALLRVLYWGQQGSLMGLSTSLATGAIPLIFTSGVLFLRHLALRQSRRLILPDQRRYDAAWAILRADPAEARALDNLAEQVTAIDLQGGLAQARQLNRRRTPVMSLKRLSSLQSLLELRRSAWSACFGSPPQSTATGRHGAGGGLSGSWEQVLSVGLPGTLDDKKPVQDFDQLYVQAIAMQPLLIRKVQAWAEVSGGFFQHRVVERGPGGPRMNRRRSGSLTLRRLSSSGSAPEPPAHFVRWDEVMGSEATSSVVKWCGLKSPGRALEKATRAYGQDCSYLVDLCRQSIYFAQVADLARCLSAMVADKEVVMVRVKNRLDPAHDAGLSGGFRNVSINLRVDSEEAREMGAETHVCEVQLILTSMARIKNEDGHRKYIAFRNLRGE